MSIIAKQIHGLSIGDPQSFENLTMIPILKEDFVEPDYSLLDQALEARGLKVKEISEGGSVPEIKVKNKSDKRILLLDGEELIGALQNRILNVSVMVPAKSSITVPVSCVEAGRWGYRNHRGHSDVPNRERARERSAESADEVNFSSAARTHFAESRRRNFERVNYSLRNHGSRRGDQSGVWQDISEKSARMDAHSSTAASDAMYQKFSSNLDDYLKAYSAVSKQVGAIFSVHGFTTGIDLFEAPEILSASLPKLVKSYSLDAIDQRRIGNTGASSVDAKKLLKLIVDADCDVYKGVGEGEDYRLEGDELAGGALVVDERLVHLCAFETVEEDGDSGDSVLRTRMHRSPRRMQIRNGNRRRSQG